MTLEIVHPGVFGASDNAHSDRRNIARRKGGRSQGDVSSGTAYKVGPAAGLHHYRSSQPFRSSTGCCAPVHPLCHLRTGPGHRSQIGRALEARVGSSPPPTHVPTGNVVAFLRVAWRRIRCRLAAVPVVSWPNICGLPLVPPVLGGMTPGGEDDRGRGARDGLARGERPGKTCARLKMCGPSLSKAD